MVKQAAFGKIAKVGRVKFSLWPRASHAPADLLAEVRAADEAGWYGVWLADHYMPNTGDAAPARGDVHEVWALLPAMAAVTSRVRILPSLYVLPMRSAVLTAKEIATLDVPFGGKRSRA